MKSPECAAAELELETEPGHDHGLREMTGNLRLRGPSPPCPCPAPAPSAYRPIPRLIVTQDESLARPGAAGADDEQPDEESPSSDSGCGGSPAPSLLLRKLSGSSLSSAGHSSSFEESEDDFSPCSDAESQPPQYLSLEDGLGVSEWGPGERLEVGERGSSDGERG